MGFGHKKGEKNQKNATLMTGSDINIGYNRHRDNLSINQYFLIDIKFSIGYAEKQENMDGGLRKRIGKPWK